MTGTPLSRGLEDLYGLFYFMHARPWADALWWREALQRPFEQGCPAGAALVETLQRDSAARAYLLWRTHGPLLVVASVDAHAYVTKCSGQCKRSQGCP